MNSWLRSIVATLALALGSGGLAGAAEFGPVAHASRALALDGQIDSGDEQLFAKALLQRYGRGEKTEYLRLNSPGGNVYAGARIAEVVHRLGLKVVVGPGEQCSSICMVIFAAGASRVFTPTSSLGVHSALDTSASSEAMNGDGETADSLAVTALMARQMSDYGAPNSIIMKMVTTPGTEITWIKTPELEQGGWALFEERVKRRQ